MDGLQRETLLVQSVEDRTNPPNLVVEAPRLSEQKSVPPREILPDEEDNFGDHFALGREEDPETLVTSDSAGEDRRHRRNFRCLVDRDGHEAIGVRLPSF